MKREIASWALGWALGAGALATLAVCTVCAACGGAAGRPTLPPPEYVQWPDSADASAGSVPLPDPDASVDVARR